MSWRQGILAAVLVLLVTGAGAWWACSPGEPPQEVEAGPATPGRIVSLTLATDEMLAELVPAERLVGVTYLADDPGISNVAGHYPARVPRLRDADVERLLALSPDLVCVAPYNTADTLKLLERSGLALYRNEAVHSLDEIEAGLRQLGERVGEAERGRRLAERMRNRRQAVARRLRGLSQRPRVLFWSAGFTAGRGATVDDLIREAGGVNVAAELGLEGSAEIAPERVVAADPEIILLSRWSADEPQAQIDQHPILRQLRAVREGHVIAVEGRYLTSVSQFAVEGLERLARRLHPERFTTEAPP
jgi:iron complex transport system substrate-binding protein